MADIFDEVSEDLRADRARRLFERYGYLLIIAAVLIVAGVGGWQFWRYRQNEQRAAVAMRFIDASRAAVTPGDPSSAAKKGAEASFAQVATDDVSGYRTLARMREAALKAGSGDLPGALALWDEVSADERADRQLRSVADLMWIQHQLDAADPAAVEGRLAPLLASNNPFRALALESEALLKLRTGDKPAAITALRQLAAQPDTPPGVRARATGLLARLGDDTDASAVAAPEPTE